MPNGRFNQHKEVQPGEDSSEHALLANHKGMIGIAGLTLFLILVFYIIYKKGVAKGERVAKLFFATKLDDLAKKHENEISELFRSHDLLERNIVRSMNEYSQSQKNLAKSLDDCRLVPDGHVQVSLSEGVSRHTIEAGYVLRVQRIFEHRAVAQEVLGRDLAPNEVVHHIYAPAKTDNSLGNLCVLDRDQHDLFHTFIERKVRQEGHYPRIQEQKRVLRDLHAGILLEEAIKNKQVTYPPIPATSEKMKAD